MPEQYHHLLAEDEAESQKKSVIIPKPIVSPATDKQIVVGPDKKRYVFSKDISQNRIDKYFAKKGIKAPEKKTTDSSTNMSGMAVGMQPSDALKSLGGTGTAMAEHTAAALPSIGAAVGGTFANVPGAALGGIVGEDLKQLIMRPILMGRGQQDLSTSRSLFNMGTEGIKQGLLQYAGNKVGEMFFNTLNKMIPHATIKNGIPLLAGDLHPDSKILKYTENLLTNLIPSAKPMLAFRTKQSEAMLTEATKIADGFSKFNGTSEQFGVLIRNTINVADKQRIGTLKRMYPTKTIDQIFKTPEGKEYISTFRNALATAIKNTDKPEEIAGFIRGTSKGSLEDNRAVNRMLGELKPAVLDKTRKVIIRDMITESAYGSKDPAVKSLQRGMGGKFTDIVNDMGEEKIKAVFGTEQANSIKKFSELVQHVDKTQGSGQGSFLNLIFAVPLRSGASTKAVSKVGALGFLFNRAAKIITSQEGVGIYEKYIRAAGQQAPRAMELARQELKTFNERSDAEYKLEEQEAEEQIKKQQENK